MSDPVTNIEIEDVLSSIRRLVSEGDRPRQKGASDQPGRQAAPTVPAGQDAGTDAAADAAARAPAAGDAPEGRFVLTPALRVVDAVTHRAAPEPAPPPAPDQTEADQTEAEDEEGDTTPAAVADDRAVDPAPAGRLSLLSTIAELEAAVTSQDDEWEPDGSEEVPVVDWASTRRDPNALLRNLGGLRTMTEPAAGTPEAPAAPAFRHVPPEDIVWAAQVLGQPVQGVAPAAGPVAAMAEDQTGDLPDDLSDDAPAALAPDTPEVDRTAGGLAQDIGRSPEGAFARDDDGPLSDMSDGLFDEEMLRNLVIEIVRQELQGTLGERITRNVRKLVRREIYRVLSSQEFE